MFKTVAIEVDTGSYKMVGHGKYAKMGTLHATSSIKQCVFKHEQSSNDQ